MYSCCSVGLPSVDLVKREILETPCPSFPLIFADRRTMLKQQRRPKRTFFVGVFAVASVTLAAKDVSVRSHSVISGDSAAR